MDKEHQVVSDTKPVTPRNGPKRLDVASPPGAPMTRPASGPVRAPEPLPDAPHRRVGPAPDCRDCLGAMAHRLAQPMTALRGGMELVLMGKRTEADYRAAIEQSMQLADDMAQLIVSLRELGESGAPGGTPQGILLEEVAAEVLAEMDSAAQARDLRLQLTADKSVKVYANPDRLREALQSLFAWVIQYCAASGTITLELTTSEGEGRLILSPPRLDLQYLQIKVLEDIATPGQLFSHAARNGTLGWAINQRLLDGLGGKLEILGDGQDGGCIRVRFPMTLDAEVGKSS